MKEKSSENVVNSKLAKSRELLVTNVHTIPIVQSVGVNSSKNSKNKLSLKVNIPLNCKPQQSNEDKQMLYIPDTSQCTQELDVTIKSQHLSPADTEQLRAKEAIQFKKMVIELREKQSEIVSLIKKLQ